MMLICKLIKNYCLLFLSLLQLNCNAQNKPAMQEITTTVKNISVATFGNGCFWCTEAVFQQLNGVEKVESGYSGGHVINPTYKQVCTGATGHAECLNISFDSTKISFAELLEVFWKTHNPTTLNQQGNDIGTQYRSVIFYHDEQQKELAEKYKKNLEISNAFDAAIVTTIEPFTTFYKAENYHQDYFKLHGEEPYCRFVIQPKLEKFKKAFKDKLKKEN